MKFLKYSSPQVPPVKQMFTLPRRDDLVNTINMYTWEHLPYRAVLESATRTAKAGSSIHTFLRGLKLQTSAVLWSRCQTADLSSCMAALQCCDPGMPQTADLGSFMAALGR